MEGLYFTGEYIVFGPVKCQLVTMSRPVDPLAGADSPFPGVEQRKRVRAAKRHALLSVAARMFNARGFHATSLDDVAAGAGVTKPTVYHYLGNKEQVLIECMAIGLNELQREAAVAQANLGSAIDRLRSFLRSYAKVSTTEFGQCVVRTGDELLTPRGQATLRSLKRPIDATLRQLIVEGIAEGSIAPCDAKMLAFTLAGAVNWISRWYDVSGPLDPDAIASQTVDFLEKGFGIRIPVPGPS